MTANWTDKPRTLELTAGELDQIAVAVNFVLDAWVENLLPDNSPLWENVDIQVLYSIKDDIEQQDVDDGPDDEQHPEEEHVDPYEIQPRQD